MTIRHQGSTLTVTLGLMLVSLLLHASVAQSAVQRMTKEELRTKLDSPDVVVVDVRKGQDWKASEEKIKGAVRIDTAKVEDIANKYDKDKTLVFYCA
jgi:predicted sulfurtransferase